MFGQAKRDYGDTIHRPTGCPNVGPSCYNPRYNQISGDFRPDSKRCNSYIKAHTLAMDARSASIYPYDHEYMAEGLATVKPEKGLISKYVNHPESFEQSMIPILEKQQDRIRAKERVLRDSRVGTKFSWIPPQMEHVASDRHSYLNMDHSASGHITAHRHPANTRHQVGPGHYKIPRDFDFDSEHSRTKNHRAQYSVKTRSLQLGHRDTPLGPGVSTKRNTAADEARERMAWTGRADDADVLPMDIDLERANKDLLTSREPEYGPTNRVVGSGSLMQRAVKQYSSRASTAPSASKSANMPTSKTFLSRSINLLSVADANEHSPSSTAKRSSARGAASTRGDKLQKEVDLRVNSGVPLDRNLMQEIKNVNEEVNELFPDSY